MPTFDNMEIVESKSHPSALPESYWALPTEYTESRWYAAYTSPHHEKWVAGQMNDSQIECFLPVYKSVRRWKDRRKQLELPLFPGYVFVRIALQDRLRVLRLPGVVQFVAFQGKPAALPEPEIEALRHGMQASAHFEPHPYLKAGRRVRVRNGAMQGVEGVLVRNKDCFRVVMTIDLIMRSVALEVDAADIEVLG
jgi:transcription termination/antitermination protein NusG